MVYARDQAAAAICPLESEEVKEHQRHLPCAAELRPSPPLIGKCQNLAPRFLCNLNELVQRKTMLSSSLWRSGFGRQRKVKTGAAPKFAFHPDVAAVRQNDVFDNG